MEGIPTGTVGNAGLSGLVGDFFHTERRSILSDEIGLTRVRRGLLLEEAIGYRWFFKEIIYSYFGLIRRTSIFFMACFVLYCVCPNFLSLTGFPSELSTGP